MYVRVSVSVVRVLVSPSECPLACPPRGAGQRIVWLGLRRQRHRLRLPPALPPGDSFLPVIYYYLCICVLKGSWDMRNEGRNTNFPHFIFFFHFTRWFPLISVFCLLSSTLCRRDTLILSSVFHSLQVILYYSVFCLLSSTLCRCYTIILSSVFHSLQVILPCSVSCLISSTFLQAIHSYSAFCLPLITGDTLLLCLLSFPRRIDPFFLTVQKSFAHFLE